MELKLKSISPEGVDAALSKAELYRFLNEPEEAESICQDVLVIQPGHQLALRLLGLAITDQFTGNPADRYAFRTPSLRNAALLTAMNDSTIWASSMSGVLRHSLA